MKSGFLHGVCCAVILWNNQWEAGILEEHHLVLQDSFTAQPEQEQSAELVLTSLCTPVLGIYWAGQLFPKSFVDKEWHPTVYRHSLFQDLSFGWLMWYLVRGKKIFGIYLEQNMLGVKINLKCYPVASGVEFVMLEMLWFFQYISFSWKCRYSLFVVFFYS